jgi:hypothetical protein
MSITLKTYKRENDFEIFQLKFTLPMAAGLINKSTINRLVHVKKVLDPFFEVFSSTFFTWTNRLMVDLLNIDRKSLISYINLDQKLNSSLVGRCKLQ